MSHSAVQLKAQPTQGLKMTGVSSDQYAAGEQGLGYIYQPRFALLKLLQWPEDTSVLIEKDDDLDFVNSNGVKTLASLKHKGDGDTLPISGSQSASGLTAIIVMVKPKQIFVSFCLRPELSQTPRSCNIF